MDILERISESVNKGINSTSKAIQIGRVRANIATLKDQQRKLFESIGEAVYLQDDKTAPLSADALILCDKVDEIKTEIAHLEDRISEIRYANEHPEAEATSVAYTEVEGVAPLLGEPDDSTAAVSPKTAGQGRKAAEEIKDSEKTLDGGSQDEKASSAAPKKRSSKKST